MITLRFFKLPVTIVMLAILAISIPIIVSQSEGTRQEIVYMERATIFHSAVDSHLQLTYPRLFGIGTYISWTQDGQYLTTIRDAVLYQFPFGENRDILITPLKDCRGDATAPVWSPDGHAFMFIGACDHNIFGHYLVELESDSVLASITYLEEYQWLPSPDWSPSGERLLFRITETVADPTRIYIFNRTDHTHMTYVIDTSLNSQVYWWDDTHFMFTHEGGIYTFDIFSGEETLLWQVEYDPLWGTNYWEISPDQTRLVYNGWLYRIDPDITQAEYISNLPSLPKWSPNGEFMMYPVCSSHWVKTGITGYAMTECSIVIADLDGNPVTTIAEDLVSSYALWRP